ncbi:hypothetical protein BaRGS_00030219 [Batillaria attramentaria]|uniref:Uncharacterized protein n=1 Tax=Batillaria attramentaria TaxID=370345 RepID=A0ABD0JV56_9CAEN
MAGRQSPFLTTNTNDRNVFFLQQTLLASENCGSVTSVGSAQTRSLNVKADRFSSDLTSGFSSGLTAHDHSCDVRSEMFTSDVTRKVDTFDGTLEMDQTEVTDIQFQGDGARLEFKCDVISEKFQTGVIQGNKSEDVISRDAPTTPSKLNAQRDVSHQTQLNSAAYNTAADSDDSTSQNCLSNMASKVQSAHPVDGSLLRLAGLTSGLTAQTSFGRIRPQDYVPYRQVDKASTVEAQFGKLSAEDLDDDVFLETSEQDGHTDKSCKPKKELHLDCGIPRNPGDVSELKYVSRLTACSLASFPCSDGKRVLDSQFRIAASKNRRRYGAEK